MARRTYPGGYVELHPGNVSQVLGGRNGPIARDLLRRGEIVKQGAQRRVGRDTGELRASIVKRFVSQASGAMGFAVIVVAEKDYALFHHEGTVPHRINGNPLLAFKPTPGEVVIVRFVNHPGTSPNRFLTEALNDLRTAR